MKTCFPLVVLLAIAGLARAQAPTEQLLWSETSFGTWVAPFRTVQGMRDSLEWKNQPLSFYTDTIPPFRRIIQTQAAYDSLGFQQHPLPDTMDWGKYYVGIRSFCMQCLVGCDHSYYIKAPCHRNACREFATAWLVPRRQGR